MCVKERVGRGSFIRFGVVDAAMEFGIFVFERCLQRKRESRKVLVCSILLL